MSIQFWAWALITAVLAGFEAIQRDLLVAPFALGAATAMLLEAAGVAPDWQWLAFFGLSSALTIWLQRVYVPRRLHAEAAPVDTSDVPARPER